MRTPRVAKLKLRKIDSIGLIAATLLAASVTVAASLSLAGRRESARSGSDSSQASAIIVTPPARSLTETPGQPARSLPSPAYKQRIRFWIMNDDIRPSVIHASPGILRLSAENLSDGDASLVIEKAAPGQARARAVGMKILRRVKGATQEAELGVGEYVFYEESRPNITGRLIVEPPR
jgi:hypothetical protein